MTQRLAIFTKKLSTSILPCSMCFTAWTVKSCRISVSGRGPVVSISEGETKVSIRSPPTTIQEIAVKALINNLHFEASKPIIILDFLILIFFYFALSALRFSCVDFTEKQFKVFWQNCQLKSISVSGSAEYAGSTYEAPIPRYFNGKFYFVIFAI